MGSIKTIDIDTKTRNDLLELIKQNPALYDRSNEDFENLAIKNALWQQISNVINLSVQECQAKYKCQLGKFSKIKKLLEDGYKITPNQFNFLKKNLFFTAYFDDSIESTNDLTYEYFSDDDEGQFDDPIELQKSVNLQKFDTIDCLVFNNNGKFETIEEIKRGDLQVPMQQKFALDKEILIDYDQPSTSAVNDNKRMLDDEDDQILPPRKRMRLRAEMTSEAVDSTDAFGEQLPKRDNLNNICSNENKNEQSPFRPEKQVDYTFGKYVAEALMCYSPMSKAKARVDIDKVLANSKLHRKL